MSTHLRLIVHMVYGFFLFVNNYIEIWSWLDRWSATIYGKPVYDKPICCMSVYGKPVYNKPVYNNLLYNKI
jgi:hypothetical protein